MSYTQSFKILQGVIVSALLSPSSWRVKRGTDRTDARWFDFFLCHACHCPFPGENPKRQLNWGNKALFDSCPFCTVAFYPSFPLSFSSPIFLQSTTLTFFFHIAFCCLLFYPIPSLLFFPLQKHSLPVSAVVSTQSTVMGFLFSGRLFHCGISVMEPLGA